MKKSLHKKLELRMTTLRSLSAIHGGDDTIVLPPPDTAGGGGGATSQCTVGCLSIQMRCPSIDICASQVACV
jgi:hypothetical protein